MISKERKINGKQIFEGRIFNVKVDSVQLDDGSITSREVVEHNGGACVVALTKDNKIALVKQFRYCFNEVLYELPAGKMEENENPKVCAIRELKEEVGATSEEIIDLGYICPTPAYDTEKIYIYLARNIVVGQNQLDDGEFLDVEFVDLQSAYAMIDSNQIKDAKTIIGILRLKSFLE